MSELQRTWTNDMPSEHYPTDCVNVKDKNVLDLGCGCFQRLGGNNYPSTSEHWIDLGASRVVGLDIVKEDVDILIGRIPSPKGLFINEAVSSPEQVKKLIVEYNIDVVKSDTEGAERFLLDMPDEDFKLVKEWYIETHDIGLYNRSMEKLKKCNYAIRNTFQWTHDSGIRLIFAYH